MATDGHPNSAEPVSSDGSSATPKGYMTCPLCDGAGKIRGGAVTCPTCNGKGQVPTSGSPLGAVTGNSVPDLAAELRTGQFTHGTGPLPLPRGATMTEMPSP
jgi:hypothetical protein